jgi:GTP 3',8-cyclase
MSALRDQLGRPLASLRVSVTDRCNLRCGYCMPQEEYVWLPKDRILSYEQIARLVAVFTGVGVDRVRLTGGEPLLRKDLPRLVSMLAGLPGLREVTLTSNGLRLAPIAAELKAAGLSRITISLDTLDPKRFRELTRREELQRVLEGLAAARDAGLAIKLNTVVMRGINHDELGALLEFAGDLGAEPRFIEFMDVGGATGWSPDTVVPRGEILGSLAQGFGPIEPEPSEDNAPARRFRTAKGQLFGVIASTSAPFCSTCDRARLTADGRLFTCLYGRDGLDLATPLRAGESDGQLAARLGTHWSARKDRGAEERLGLAQRGALASPDELRDDPHLEMHTRGG